MGPIREEEEEEEDLVEIEARTKTKVRGVEIDEEGGGFGPIDQTEDPISEQEASLAQRFPQHLPYHHLPAVEAALVVA